MMKANPWKLSDENREAAARMLESYFDSLDGPLPDEHPVQVAHDHMIAACHLTGSVEVGAIIRGMFIAMKYGGEEARDRLLAIVACLSMEYEPLDPEWN